MEHVKKFNSFVSAIKNTDHYQELKAFTQNLYPLTLVISGLAAHRKSLADAQKQREKEEKEESKSHSVKTCLMQIKEHQTFDFYVKKYLLMKYDGHFFVWYEHERAKDEELKRKEEDQSALAVAKAKEDKESQRKKLEEEHMAEGIKQALWPF